MFQARLIMKSFKFAVGWYLRNHLPLWGRDWRDLCREAGEGQCMLAASPCLKQVGNSKVILIPTAALATFLAWPQFWNGICILDVQLQFIIFSVFLLQMAETTLVASFRNNKDWDQINMSEGYLSSREKWSQSGFFNIRKVATWEGEKWHWVHWVATTIHVTWEWFTLRLVL